MLGKFLFAFFIVLGYTNQTTVKAENDGVTAEPAVSAEAVSSSAEACGDSMDLSEEDANELLRALDAAPEKLDMSWQNQARTMLAVTKAKCADAWENNRTEVIAGVVATVVVGYLIYHCCSSSARQT
jgi:hypothetical protein